MTFRPGRRVVVGGATDGLRRDLVVFAGMAGG